MKTHWKLMMVVAVLSLALLVPAASAMAATATVLTGGNTTGTWQVTLDQAADGSLSGPALGPGVVHPGAANIHTQSTHGNYKAQNGDLYINTFTPAAAYGGKYGLVKIDGSTGVESFIPLALTVNTALGAQSVEVPVSMMCATDTDSRNHPNVLAIGDISDGLEWFYHIADDGLAAGQWAAVVAGTGTNCDMSFNEGDGDKTAISTGHHNNVNYWSNAQDAHKGVQPTPEGMELGAAKLGHQNRYFELDGEAYWVWSDGSAGDLVFVRINGNLPAGRHHVIEGENHSVGLDLGMNSVGTGAINGIVPNFADGSLTGVQITRNMDGSINVAVKNTVAGTGTLADICGLDIVNVAGKGWRRN